MGEDPGSFDEEEPQAVGPEASITYVHAADTMERVARRMRRIVISENSAAMRIFGNVVVGSFVASIVVAVILFPSSDPWRYVLIALAHLSTFLASFYLNNWLQAQLAKRLVVTDPRRYWYVTISINDAGVLMQTDISYQLYAWYGVQKVVREDGVIYFAIGASHSVIVPEAAFAKPEECEAFLTSARALHTTWRDRVARTVN